MNFFRTNKRTKMPNIDNVYIGEKNEKIGNSDKL